MTKQRKRPLDTTQFKLPFFLLGETRLNIYSNTQQSTGNYIHHAVPWIPRAYSSRNRSVPLGQTPISPPLGPWQPGFDSPLL